MSSHPPLSSPDSVLRCDGISAGKLSALAGRYGVTVTPVASQDAIAGSFWGDSEAGLVGTRLFVRADTPVHSALHELSHFVCMSAARRRQLDTNAGGDYAEENAVCYLQILLSDFVPPMAHQRMLQDMDSWGYSFRLGSAARWFNEDADDARTWLLAHQLISAGQRPTWRLREASG